MIESPAKPKTRRKRIDPKEYRIAMPVTEMKRLGTRAPWEPDGINVFSICPRCDRTLPREYVAFCDRCGQKLKWNTKRKLRE